MEISVQEIKHRAVIASMVNCATKRMMRTYFLIKAVKRTLGVSSAGIKRLIYLFCKYLRVKYGFLDNLKRSVADATDRFNNFVY